MISLNFNLREPKGNKSTNVYCVIRYGTVQLKLSMGCKVNSWQWDKKRQIPKFTQKMSEEEKNNNTRVFNIISSVRFAFLDYFPYLCTNSQSISDKEVRDFINKNILNKIKHRKMEINSNPKKHSKITPKATTLLSKAFDKYYSEIKTKAKESAKKPQLSHLNAFIKYCTDIKKDDISMLSQKGINEYKSYLIKKQKEAEKEGAKRYGNNTSINAKCELIERLINKVISEDNPKIAKVSYQKLEETAAEGENKKRRPLKDDEIEKLLNCKELTPEEKEYRDLFVLECYCAYRIGDTEKLFNKKKQNNYQIDDYDFIVINTQKESIDAVIWSTDKVKEILKRYENGFQYIEELGSRNYIDKFNRIIKKIAKKAGLNSTETYLDSHDRKKSQPLYEIIASHFGRYTFIYNGLFKIGFLPEELKDFTGHADDTMINDVYAVYSQEDKVKKAAKAIRRVFNRNNEDATNIIRNRITRNNINEQDDLIREIKDALYCLGADLNELVDINDYHELNVILYNDYHMELVELGIDKDVKEVYRLDKLSLAERRKAIKELKDKITLERLASEALE